MARHISSTSALFEFSFCVLRSLVHSAVLPEKFGQDLGPTILVVRAEHEPIFDFPTLYWASLDGKISASNSHTSTSELQHILAFR